MRQNAVTSLARASTRRPFAARETLENCMLDSLDLQRGCRWVVVQVLDFLDGLVKFVREGENVAFSKLGVVELKGREANLKVKCGIVIWPSKTVAAFTSTAPAAQTIRENR